jgi:hypothetical protein
MLPGIRLLFATFVLSASILIFGLGAAALLRSAHEEFVGIPSWRAAQQPMAPAMDTNRPMLALVRVDPPAPAPKADIKNDVSSKSEIAPQDEKPSDELKTASVDTQAADKAVIGEKSANAIKPDEVRRPRVRRAKRARTVHNVKLIRHWSARTQQTIQPQQSVTNSNAPFIGFDAPDQTASSGTGSNRRTAARSPF